jgi:hypothetical protein
VAQGEWGFSPCKGKPQGLKPNFVSNFCDTTKVVP